MSQERAAILAFDAAMWVKQTVDNAIAPVMLAAAMVQYNPRLGSTRSMFDGLAPAMFAQVRGLGGWAGGSGVRFASGKIGRQATG